MILIAQQMYQLKTLLRKITMSRGRQKYPLIPQERISGHKHDKKNFNQMFYIEEKSAGLSWMKKKNKMKNLNKNSEKKVAKPL